MRFKTALAALAATAAFATPAAAQVATDTEETVARGTVLRAFSISELTDLDFGTIISSALAGTVTINEDDGSRSVTGGVAEYGLDAGNRATFSGVGPAGGQVDLTLTPPVGNVLYNTDLSGTTVTVSSLVLDAGGATTRTIDAAGGFSVGVGGTFAIAAGQREGVYESTFDLTAEYQ